jgi:predicted AAA+ superfamily ATPase
MNGQKVIIVYGPRQVGKTSLIHHVLDQSGFSYKALLGEEKHVQESFSNGNYSRMMEAVGKNQILFIDEAQAVVNIGTNIKILHDQNKSLRIILSGSSSFQLANHTQEPLTGRKKTFLLYPIAIAELLQLGLTPLDVRNNLSLYLRYGLYPDILAQETIEDKEETLRELVNSYLYRDILLLADIKHSHKLHDLLRLLALQMGSTVSVNKLSNALNMSSHTVEHYLNLLEQSFVIFRLRGFSKNLSKEISKMDKFYFYDSGVRNAILNNFNAPENRQDSGAIWENFLITERLKSNEYNRRHPNSYFWRTYTGAEIDYIEEKDGNLCAYEFKYNSKQVKAPKTWVEQYPEATFDTVNSDNFFEFIS